MTKLLQTLVNSIALGSLYALTALGYTLVYGVLRFINFAHSDVFTVGAWVSFVIAGSARLGDDGLAVVRDAARAAARDGRVRRARRDDRDASRTGRCAARRASTC